MLDTTQTMLPAGAVVTAPGEGRSVWVAGFPITWKVTGDRTNQALSVLEAAFPPGAGIPLHVHHRHDEAFFVVEGAFNFQVGDCRRSLTSGAFVYVPRGTPHAMTCSSTTWASLVTCVTPGGLESAFDRISQTPLDDVTNPAFLAELREYHDFDVLGTSFRR